MADSGKSHLAFDQVWAVFEPGAVDGFAVDCGCSVGVVVCPLRVEEGDADSFADDVGAGVVGMANRAEIDHAGAHADFEGFVEKLDRIECRVDRPVLVGASGKEAKDAGATGFNRYASESQGGFGYLVTDAVGPVREIARFELLGFLTGGPGPDVDDCGFDDILIDALAAK